MVGHKSNSKADEIGKAMQKASASATEAGLSFEWLGAYIATVSEKTRQAPEVIGTAYNSIIARLHNIKAKGFNEEDETKINDIAKALASLPEPLKLIDSMTGEWMSMSEIFSSIAAQWSNLDDKQRAYIATTMAGSRQQNVFITLMNDMAKGLEGGSRAYELYTGAQTSAGNATQKYAVYQESLTAIQEKSTAKWEEFYNRVVNADVLKEFYSSLGNIADFLTNVTQNTDGWNLKIIALSASLVAIVSIIGKIKNALSAAGGARMWFSGLTTTSQISLIISGLTQLSEIIMSVTSHFKEAEQAVVDYSETISSKSSLIESVKPLIEEYESLSQKTTRTVEEQQRMNDLFIQIRDSSGEFAAALLSAKVSVDNQTGALQAMDQALKTVNEDMVKYSALQAKSTLSNEENKTRWQEAFYSEARANLGSFSRFAPVDVVDGYSFDINPLNYSSFEEYAKEYDDFIKAYKMMLNEDLTGSFDPDLIRQMGTQWEALTAAMLHITDTIDNQAKWSTFKHKNPDYSGDIRSYFLQDYYNEAWALGDSAQRAATESADQARNEISDSLYNIAKQHFEDITFAQDEALRESIDSFVRLQTTDTYGVVDVDKLVSEFESGLATLVSSIQSDTNIETDAANTILEHIFGSKDTWSESVKKFSDEMAIAIEQGIISSDTIRIAKQNIDRFFGSDEKSKEDLWNKILGGSPEEQVEIIKAWEDNIKGISSLLNGDNKVDYFGYLSSQLMSEDYGYTADDVATFYQKIYNVLADYPDLLSEIQNMFSDGIISNEELEKLFQTVTNMNSDDYLSEQRAQTEGTLENWQKFFEDIGELSASDEEGMGSFLAKMIGADEESLENLAQAFSALDSEAQKALKESSGFSKEFWEDVADGGEMSADSIKELDRAQSRLNIKKEARYFDKTADAIAGLADGSVDATEAFESFNDETDAQNNALTEYEAGTKKLSQGMELTTDDVQTLADYLSTTPENIMNSWDSVGTLLTSAITEGSNALSVLRDNAFINIVGTSSVDFSAVYSGLLDVKAVGEEAAAVLATLGMFKIETKTMPYDFTTMGQNGEQIHYKGNSTANVLVPTGNNPFKGSSVSKPSSGGGGGGGGGGGSSKVDNTADEQKLVDNMTWQIESVDRRMAQLNAIMSKYETEGYLTGIINCLKMENDLLGEQNTLYQNNLITLDGKLKSLRSQLSGLTPGTAEYDDVLAQIAILQDAYSEYTLALLENEAAQAENAEAMKEQEKAIRQLEIDLRDELLQAIEDREAREEEALEARIEMEETLMDIIRKRYEEERDQILKNTELQIESLEREKDALDEALEARREAEEEQDRAAELAELEAQYARIIADPTRAKEAQEIRNKINDLRDEIAWDTAEKEVEAQQESLDQQITSLEDYAEYIENYYDELLENPQNFIAEVNSILNQSQEDILTWLKENSEEYATATEATQKQITDGWTETLNSMHGVIETHWAEIENIIAQGDEAILKFLMDNRQDYAEAGKLQAEAYVDAWKEQLEDLDRAYKDLVPKVTDDKKTNTTATSTGSGGSSGGGGGSSGGGSGSGSANQTKTEPKKQGLWKFTFDGKESFGFSSASSAHNAINQSEAAYAQWYYNKYKTEYNADTIADTANGIAKAKANNARKTLTEYRRGGIADFTGPAWVDGTKTNPERILTPYQTKLFEDMIATLHRIDKVRIPSLPAISDVGNGNGGNSFNFGDIILNVDKLSDDEDFEEVAEKICAYVVDRMNRGSSIGGIRQTK